MLYYQLFMMLLCSIMFGNVKDKSFTSKFVRIWEGMVIIMKKLVFGILMILCLASIAGCSNKNLSIDSSKVSENTIVAKKNGKLQVATVEAFDKSYYKLAELEEFAQKEVSNYNKKAGGEQIKIDDIHLNNEKSKAVMVLSYDGMEQYASFNEVPAAYFDGGISNYPLTVPDSLINARGRKSADTKDVFKNNRYKILVMYEPYDIIVDGRIAYYSKGAEMISNNKIKCAADGATVVVYKP